MSFLLFNPIPRITKFFKIKIHRAILEETADAIALNLEGKERLIVLPLLSTSFR